MIRYVYGNETDSLAYILNNIINKDYIGKFDDDNITLSITFDPISIIFKGRPLDKDTQIDFYISGLLYKKSKDSDELVNTT